MFRAGFAPISLLTCAALLASGSAATGAPRGHVPKPDSASPDAIGRLLLSMEQAPAAAEIGARSRPSTPLTQAPAATLSAADIHALKDAIRLARRGNGEMAARRSQEIGDGVSRQLVEWLILRSDDGTIGFARYAAFIRANPSWPSLDLIRRRAEARLWSERHEPGTVLAFFSDREPLGALGKLAIARALVSHPRVVMVDELSLGLAPRIVADLLAVLRGVADDEGTGFLLVEQHVGFALRSTDRYYVLESGRITGNGEGGEGALDDVRAAMAV